MTADQFKLKYDSFGDVLYFTTPTNRPALADEDDLGLLWRYAVDGGDLVGVTVLDFSAYWSKHKNDLASRISAQFLVPEGEIVRLLSEVKCDALH